MLLLEFKILLEQGVYSINHVLDQFDFGRAQTVLVGDVVGESVMAIKFLEGSTGLNLQFFTTCFHGCDTLLGPAWKVHANGSAQTCAQAGRARLKVTVLGVEKEVLSRLLLDSITNSLDATGKTVKDTFNITP